MAREAELDAILETAQAAVREASAACLRYFQHEFEIETKADRTPVTPADRAAEAAIVEVIRGRFPDHTILSEESGLLEGRPDHRWIVDPLDGTRGFARGGHSWGPLVAFEREGRVVAGAMALPARGQTYWAAHGRGSYRDGTPLRLVAAERLEQATLSVGELRILLRSPHASAVGELIRAAASTRCEGDLAGCAMLLDGRADAWLEAGVKLWDLGPLQLLVEEAGGCFTDFGGRGTIASGHALAAGSGLHGRILELLQGAAQA